MSKSKTELGNRIRLAIRNADLTYDQVGDKIGVSKQAVQKWAGGHSNPTLANLETLSKILRVNIQWLMTGSVANITIPFGLQKELSEFPRNSKDRAERLVRAVLHEFGMNGFTFDSDSLDDYLDGMLTDARFYENVYSEVEARITNLRDKLY